jgi:glutamyl/glutaminyl-tRNA synthetase
LKQAINILQNIEEKDFMQENIKSILMSIAEKMESRGEILHPVRFALSGMDKSPDPFVIASIIGKNETLSRLQKAI